MSLTFLTTNFSDITYANSGNETKKIALKLIDSLKNNNKVIIYIVPNNKYAKKTFCKGIEGIKRLYSSDN